MTTTSTATPSVIDASSDSHSKDNPPTEVGPADVAVFWDYENVRIPEWCPVANASSAIREKVITFGRVVERRLYYDSSKPPERNMSRSELDLSGFTLVDCPSRNHKETLDKKLIVDVLFFAWERASRGAKACVVLITSDGDYSYTLARLQDIGVQTIIMFRPDVVAKVLIDNANIVLSWDFDVLGAALEGNLSTLEKTTCEDLEANDKNPGSTALVATVAAGSNHPNSNDSLNWTTVAPQRRVRHPTDGMFALFCNCVLNGQQRRVIKGITLYQSWGPNAHIASEFYQKFGRKDKERYTALLSLATRNGFVEWGRRKLNVPGTPVVPCQRDEKDGLSLETYLRLTYAGLAIVRPNLDLDRSAKEESWKGSN